MQSEPRGGPRGTSISLVAEDFPPRMQHMLDAARRLVAAKGADSLSLRALAEESGETTSLILYYFDSMETLHALLIDSLWHKIDVEYVAELDSLPENTGARIDALLAFHARVANEPDVYRIYADLVANVLHSPRARATVAEVYTTYRDSINRPALALTDLDDERTRAYSGLILAASEGIPLHVLTMPTGRAKLVVDDAFALLAFVLKRRMGEAVRPPGYVAPVDESSDRPVPEPMPTAHAAERLVTAAQSLIRENGIRALSLKAIAERSGEARPAVGYYFQNKQGFLDKVIAATIADWVQLFDDVIDDGLSDVARLRDALFAEDSPVLAMVLVLPAITRDAGLRESAERANAYVRRRLARYFEEREPSLPAPRHAASASLFLACVAGLALQHLYDSEGFDLAGAVDALHELRIGS